MSAKAVSSALITDVSTIRRLRRWFESDENVRWPRVTTRAQDRCIGISPSPRSPQTSQSDCRWDGRSPIQSTDFTSTRPKLSAGTQSPRASASPLTLIEHHPCWTTAATGRDQGTHPLDVNDGEMSSSVSHFSSSTGQMGGRVCGMPRGADCWRHCRMHAVGELRYTLLDENSTLSSSYQ